MRNARLFVGASAAACVWLLGTGAAAGDDPVVVRVGDTRVTVAEVESRLADMPSFQREQYGKSRDEVVRKFVEEVVVVEALYAEAARKRKLDEEPVVRDRIRGVLRRALEYDVRRSVADDDPVTDDEVKRYYEKNESRYVTPRRLQIWRILVDDRDLAETVIGKAKKAKDTKSWGELAREHSVDEATKLRNGNLGFVRPDGSTDAPRVKVDPALFEAADAVKNGELVPNPVKEGDKWAVVWRRGGLAAVTRTVDDEAHTIRQILAREKIQKGLDSLVQKLKKTEVKEVNEELLQYVTVTNQGDVRPASRPGVLPRRPPRRSPKPEPGERGNR